VSGETALLLSAGLLCTSACTNDRTWLHSNKRTLPALETIAWAVGPCFGFCPVYKAQVDANGRITFNDERNTATSGQKIQEAGGGAYRTVR
jgi:hypothetical protein